MGVRRNTYGLTWFDQKRGLTYSPCLGFMWFDQKPHADECWSGENTVEVSPQLSTPNLTPQSNIPRKQIPVRSGVPQPGPGYPGARTRPGWARPGRGSRARLVCYIRRGVDGKRRAGTQEGRCWATRKREFKLPWRKASPPNHRDDEVDSVQ